MEPHSSSLFERDAAWIAPTYSRFPLALCEGGHGAYLKAEDGTLYLDFGTGIAVNTFGASDPVWAEAVIAQVKKLAHTSNLYYSEPDVALAEELCRRTGMKQVFFGNSGAEANECAIKVARKWGHEHKGPDCHEILTLEQSFHGRTLATLAATGQAVFHTDFGPFPAGFYHTPADDEEALVRALDAHPGTCAVLFECVQGEGGVRALAPSFVRAIERECKRRDILLMVDEVQTGNGRTGTLYAFEQYGLMPDVFTTAKGLGGGLPIGACLFGERVRNVLGPGKHGSTFGGNPVACAGALNILQRLDEPFLATVRERADCLRKKAAAIPGVGAVTGLGLMIGLEVENARAVANAALEEHLLVLTAKDKVRLLPPLNLTPEEIDDGIARLTRAVAKASQAGKAN